MFNIQNMLRQTLFSLVLGAAALTAHADVPTYQVTVDTRALGSSGFLDLSFVGGAGAPGATAIISGMQGAFGAIDLSEGAVNELPGIGFSIGDDAGWNFLSHGVTFGGLFSFDLAFKGDFLDVPGDKTSVFSVSLLDLDFNAIGSQEGVAVFYVTPLSNQGPAAIGFSTDSFANVSVVPEPSKTLLLLGGLAMLGFAARRRLTVFIR
jgi:hypothetical protein